MNDILNMSIAEIVKLKRVTEAKKVVAISVQGVVINHTITCPTKAEYEQYAKEATEIFGNRQLRRSGEAAEPRTDRGKFAEILLENHVEEFISIIRDKSYKTQRDVNGEYYADFWSFIADYYPVEALSDLVVEISAFYDDTRPTDGDKNAVKKSSARTPLRPTPAGGTSEPDDPTARCITGAKDSN